MKIIENNIPEYQEVVLIVKQGLKDNQEKYGKRYCPCVQIDESEDNSKYICMCEEFRNNKDMKMCHCGLYLRVD